MPGGDHPAYLTCVARDAWLEPWSALAHGDADTLLAGSPLGDVVAGVDVPDDAHRRVVGQDTGELLGGELGAVREGHLAGVQRAADSDTTAVVDRHPARARGGVDEGVQQRPVG